MHDRSRQPTEHRVDFFVRGCDVPVGIFRGPTYPTTPGRFKYEPYRGPGHVAFLEALENGQSAERWYTYLGRRVDFEVSREEFVLGAPGSFSDWFVHVSSVAGIGSDYP